MLATFVEYWSILIDTQLCELQNLTLHIQAYAYDKAVMATNRVREMMLRNVLLDTQ